MPPHLPVKCCSQLAGGLNWQLVHSHLFCRHDNKGCSGRQQAPSWGLQSVNKESQSIFSMFGTEIPKVTSSQLHMGMVFASSTWHHQEQMLPSISYLHRGAAITR